MRGEHWRRFAALDTVGQKSLDTAVSDLRKAVLAIPPAKNENRQGSGRWVRSAIYYQTGKTARTDACIEWLRKTGQFTEGQLQTARRIRFFKEEENGQVVVRKQPLQERHATFIIGLLCLLAGLWIGWVLFGSRAGLLHIVYSLSVGMILGSVAGGALDYSFRFARIRNKVADIAPFLVTSPLEVS